MGTAEEAARAGRRWAGAPECHASVARRQACSPPTCVVPHEAPVLGGGGALDVAQVVHHACRPASRQGTLGHPGHAHTHTHTALDGGQRGAALLCHAAPRDGSPAAASWRARCIAPGGARAAFRGGFDLPAPPTLPLQPTPRAPGSPLKTVSSKPVAFFQPSKKAGSHASYDSGFRVYW